MYNALTSKEKQPYLVRILALPGTSPCFPSRRPSHCDPCDPVQRTNPLLSLQDQAAADKERYATELVAAGPPPPAGPKVKRAKSAYQVGRGGGVGVARRVEGEAREPRTRTQIPLTFFTPPPPHTPFPVQLFSDDRLPQLRADNPKACAGSLGGGMLYGMDFGWLYGMEITK